MSAEIEGKTLVHVKMRASVGTLRSQSVYWLESDRAQRLIGRRLAEFVEAPPAPGIIAAVEETAKLLRDRHRMEVQADGEKSDQGTGKARTRRRPGNGDGGSDPASRLDESTNGEQG